MMQVVGVFHNLLVGHFFLLVSLTTRSAKLGSRLASQCTPSAIVELSCRHRNRSIQLYTPWAMMAVCSDEEYGPMKTELAAHSYLETYLAYGWLLHLMTC